jgi:hypothetical protein
LMRLQQAVGVQAFLAAQPDFDSSHGFRDLRRLAPRRA